MSNRRPGFVTVTGDVKFWTWVDDSTLAYVVWESQRGSDGTLKANVPVVYHWNGVEPDQKPVKTFAAENLANVRIPPATLTI